MVLISKIRRWLTSGAAALPLLENISAHIAEQANRLHERINATSIGISNQSTLLNTKLSRLIEQQDRQIALLQNAIAGIANQSHLLDLKLGAILAQGEATERVPQAVEAARTGLRERPDDLETALTRIRNATSDEGAAAHIFDRLLIEVLKPHHRAISWGDRLLTLDKSLGFKKHPDFEKLLGQIDPTKGSNQYASPDGISWRMHTMIWAASCAMRVPGDFVECGITQGDMPWIITEALDLPQAGKSFYAYDSFEGFDPRYSSEQDFPEAPSFFYQLNEESRADPERHQKVVRRFSAKPHVKIIKGVVPDILSEIAPESIAFLHLDMNAPLAEKGALEKLFSRLSPGAILIFDDYGWILYRRVKEVADEFLGARGYTVLELPTGQGLVII